MKNEIDLSNYNIRTDLIIETIEKYPDLDGIKRKTSKIDDIVLEEVEIDEVGEKNCGKKKGLYKTITFDDVTDNSNRKKIEDVFCDALKKFLEDHLIKESDTCLLIGLGNPKSTPDALGPKTIESVLVTKHLFDMKESNVLDGYRNVSAFSPGVTGTTGIETKNFILGITRQVKPDFLIVIDALASSSVDRVNKTIQMTDTGIHPGSGVGNSRCEISKDTIGIPVFAIGIPTVVDAVTIVTDTIFYMIKHFSYNKENIKNYKTKLIPFMNRNYLEHEENLSREDKMKLMGLLGSLNEDEMKELVFEVLTPIGYNLMVTPKEVDFLIDKLSQVLAKGINRALHRQINQS